MVYMMEIPEVSDLKSKILKIAKKISNSGDRENKMEIFLEELKPVVSNINLVKLFPKASDHDYFFLLIYHLKYSFLRIWKNLFLDAPFDAEKYGFFADFIENLVVLIEEVIDEKDTNLIFSINKYIISMYYLFYKKNEKK